jgi:hypothetical protein
MAYLLGSIGIPQLSIVFAPNAPGKKSNPPYLLKPWIFTMTLKNSSMLHQN